jgi:RNA polymerase sigma factor (sigma-70 family)
MRRVRSDQSSRAEPPVPLGAASSTEEVAKALIGTDASLRKMVRWCLRHLGRVATNEDAAEILQEFLAKRLARVVARYEPGAQSLESWVYLCLARFCWKHGKQLKKKRDREPSLATVTGDRDGNNGTIAPKPDEIEAARTDIINGLVREEDRVKVHSLLSTLSRQDQEVLRLHYGLELTASQIAAQLNISAAAVDGRLHHARRRFKAKMIASQGAGA